jgi:hypothetical protein
MCAVPAPNHYLSPGAQAKTYDPRNNTPQIPQPRFRLSRMSECTTSKMNCALNVQGVKGYVLPWLPERAYAKGSKLLQAGSLSRRGQCDELATFLTKAYADDS